MVKKRKLWSYLVNLINGSNSLSIVLGDFNEVRATNERLGTIFCPLGAKYFNDFIFEVDLHDLNMGGKRFTRMNKFGSQLSKIDQILVSSHFVSKWPNAQLVALPRELSDHCPLVLKCLSMDFGPTPFKFYNSWLAHKDLPSLVKNSWEDSSSSFIAHLGIHFKTMLKNLKGVIRNWRASSCNLELANLKLWRTKVDSIDNKAETGYLSFLESEERSLLMKNILDLEK